MYTQAAAGAGSGAQQSQTVDRLREVDLNVFLKLLIAELQSQDPMSPMDNHEILQQISQIREIESNSRLTETLQAVTLGQTMTTASNLIGRTVEGLSNDGVRVSGKVDRVSVTDGKAMLHIGTKSVSLANVGEIRAEPPGGADEA
jgi:flagellar basal-body rod modification protein FlgD